MSINQRFLEILAVIALLLSLNLGCSKTQETREESIATVGNRSIDWRLLHRSYQLDPKWGRGLTQREAHDNQLNYLIEQKLFAQEAIANGLDTEKSIAGVLNATKEKEMIKELYRQEVASRVNISDEEYRSAYQRSKKKVKFEFVSTPDSAHAEAYRKQLLNASIEMLQLQSPSFEQKGTSPMFSFGDMASELEEVVFNIQPGEVSGPIKIDNDYMVVKLIDGEVDRFMSEMDLAENKSKIQKVIFERRARQISDEYIYEMLSKQEVKISPPIFYALAEQFSRIVHNKSTGQPFPIYLSNSELKTAQSNLKDIADEVLVTFKGGQFTVEEFLRKLWDVPAGMRPQVNMAPQLKKAIAVTVRNRYLAQEAYQQGLDKLSQVQYEVEAQNDEVLSRYYIRKLRDKITVTAEEIAEFMNKENFAAVNKSLNGKLDTAAVRGIVLDYKLTQQRIKIADSLRAVYTVRVDTALFEAHLPEADKIIQEKPVGFFYRDQFN